jgi:hypothetical protein
MKQKDRVIQSQKNQINLQKSHKSKIIKPIWLTDLKFNETNENYSTSEVRTAGKFINV